MLYEKLITTQLKQLDIDNGDTLLIHSSYKSFGEKNLTMEDIITGIMNAVGEQGTILFPSHSYVTVTKENPYFDVLNTPCCVGAIPEYFRKRHGTIRSVNPTHSVCGIGKNAQEILSQHIMDISPCGENSPYRLLPKYNGKIVFLGCSNNCNTSIHSIEEVIEPPYLFEKFIPEYIVKLPNGNITKLKCKHHNFKGITQRYDRMENLLSKSELRIGNVIGATVYVMDSKAVWKKAKEKFNENPFYFVDKE